MYATAFASMSVFHVRSPAPPVKNGLPVKLRVCAKDSGAGEAQGDGGTSQPCGHHILESHLNSCNPQPRSLPLSHTTLTSDIARCHHRYNPARNMYYILTVYISWNSFKTPSFLTGEATSTTQLTKHLSPTRRRYITDQYTNLCKKEKKKNGRQWSASSGQI